MEDTTDRIYLHRLTLEDIEKLTKEQFQALTPEHVAKDLTDLPQMKVYLLKVIRRKAISYFKAKHFLCQKLSDKINRLENGDTKNAAKRERREKAAAATGKVPTTRNAHPYNDPNVFVKHYSEEKYGKHPISTKKYDTTILQTHGGKVIKKVDIPTDEDLAELGGDVDKRGESGLYFATYYPLSRMSDRQKNDTVAIIGRGFGRSTRGFNHNDAGVAHGILQRELVCAGVMLVTYVPKPQDGEKAMEYTVCAAVFTFVETTRHKRNGKTTKMQSKLLKAVNLLQIATLPQWGGRNLGGILLEHCTTERLIEYDFDLMIICGCTEGFYHEKVSLERAPKWLEKPPWTLKYLEDAHAKAGDMFSFTFLDEVIKSFMSVAVSSNKEEEEATAGLEHLQIEE
eukprot:scaffold5627_cov158-Amphora_coffeaeformis.AAC.5